MVLGAYYCRQNIFFSRVRQHGTAAGSVVVAAARFSVPRLSRRSHCRPVIVRF